VNRRALPALGLALAVVCGLSRLAGAQPAAAAAQTYMVSMRDGVKLATDVRPGAGPGPWAVILIRTPYGRKATTLTGLEDYAIVTQDVRGRPDSGGLFHPFFDDGWGEHQDGLDTVKWVLAQPWCNGRIGTWGYSALGITQNMLAGAGPPGVQCQQIIMAAGSLYQHAVYPGGVFRQELMATWLTSMEAKDQLELMLAHPRCDALWEMVDSVTRLRRQRIDIAALHIGGWFDLFAQGTIDSFTARTQISPDQWLVMGPWAHGPYTCQQGELVFPESAAQLPAPGADVAMWCDFWLRGKDNGVRAAPRVQYYVMGACGEEDAPGNEWRAAGRWPPPARLTSLFLAPSGVLARRPPAAAGSLKYDYDPTHPAPTQGGATLFVPSGPRDQRTIETRPDVLVFSTQPLPCPVEVTGQVRLRLYAASSARDTMFTAKLCDVYPDGRSMLIADGALRAASRKSFSDPTPIEPGRIYQYQVELGPTSIIFNRGHRIRLEISSSNSPRFAVHPNQWMQGKPQVAHQTVHYGRPYPSALLLPVVAAKEDQPAAHSSRDRSAPAGDEGEAPE
jgi:predicted acyl esterase